MGLLIIIGLVLKNVILIVEFVIYKMDEGMKFVDVVVVVICFCLCLIFMILMVFVCGVLLFVIVLSVGLGV